MPKHNMQKDFLKKPLLWYVKIILVPKQTQEQLKSLPGVNMNMIFIKNLAYRLYALFNALVRLNKSKGVIARVIIRLDKLQFNTIQDYLQRLELEASLEATNNLIANLQLYKQKVIDNTNYSDTHKAALISRIDTLIEEKLKKTDDLSGGILSLTETISRATALVAKYSSFVTDIKNKQSEAYKTLIRDSDEV